MIVNEFFSAGRPAHEKQGSNPTRRAASPAFLAASMRAEPRGAERSTMRGGRENAIVSGSRIKPRYLERSRATRQSPSRKRETGPPRCSAPHNCAPAADSHRRRRDRSHELSPTLRQAWPRARPGAAMCVRSVDDRCVLQFTLVHAAGCVLHRRTSRVIHRRELSFSISSRNGDPSAFYKIKLA